ncbi:MAG TPA: methionine--tRNA ligase [Streptosporangiaceae bacterium]|jgi:methionyl-tRNA synthetase
MTERIYLSTTIPYVNARPHLGFALELVQADALARHYRQRGDLVRFQTGTDDNSLKNVLAAQAEGVPVRALVRRNAAAFAELAGPLALSYDDFIQTSSDPRHLGGAQRLWRACAERGDLYRKEYHGLYCVGCEQFYREAELTGGRCPEHGTVPQLVSERNWFFRLSRYREQLHDLISSGLLRVEPAGRRNEVLAFIASGLEDFSVSRSTQRAHGWGIPVPGDPGQVMYVWWDALGNYISALGYGGQAEEYERWWRHGDRRVHLVGKGVLRFHAVYWPAMLLSAGEPLPTDILVHDYLTTDGRKISKSGGGTPDPVALVRQFGTDSVRWWLLREVPRVGDADFTAARLIARANADLAGGLGNLVSRTVAMVHRYRGGVVPGDVVPAEGADLGGVDPGGGEGWAGDPGAGRLLAACEQAPGLVDAALGGFDFRAAADAIWDIVDAANRYIEDVRPWQLARSHRHPEAARLDAVLALLVHACRCLAGQLAPFVPDIAARLAAQCTPADLSGRLPEPEPVFPRIQPA